MTTTSNERAFPTPGTAIYGISFREWLAGQFAAGGQTPSLCVEWADALIRLLNTTK